jgi:hypothetical protein
MIQSQSRIVFSPGAEAGTRIKRVQLHITLYLLKYMVVILLVITRVIRALD